MSRDDEYFSGGISSAVEQFYDDGWVLIYPSTLVIELGHLIRTLLYIFSYGCISIALGMPTPILYHPSSCLHPKIKGGMLE